MDGKRIDDNDVKTLNKIKALLEKNLGGKKEAHDYLNASNKDWFGLSAMDLIFSGKEKEVLEYIKSNLEYTGVF